MRLLRCLTESYCLYYGKVKNPMFNHLEKKKERTKLSCLGGFDRMERWSFGTKNAGQVSSSGPAARICMSA